MYINFSLSLSSKIFDAHSAKNLFLKLIAFSLCFLKKSFFFIFYYIIFKHKLGQDAHRQLLKAIEKD